MPGVYPLQSGGIESALSRNREKKNPGVIAALTARPGFHGVARGIIAAQLPERNFSRPLIKPVRGFFCAKSQHLTFHLIAIEVNTSLEYGFTNQGVAMSNFTTTELHTLMRACELSYHKKDLELRRVRRNKDVIEEAYQSADACGIAGDVGVMSFDEQIEAAKNGKAEFLQLKNKIKYLLREQQ